MLYNLKHTGCPCQAYTAVDSADSCYCYCNNLDSCCYYYKPVHYCSYCCFHSSCCCCSCCFVLGIDSYCYYYCCILLAGADSCCYSCLRCCSRCFRTLGCNRLRSCRRASVLYDWRSRQRFFRRALCALFREVFLFCPFDRLLA